MKHVRRICAVLLAAVVLLPIVLLCVQAFVPPFDALMISTGSEPLRLLPIPFSAEQWQMLFNQSAYWQAFWNSLIWTVGACVVQVMVAFLGGYVLAKYPARWCVAIAGLYTLMMLMPPQMTLLPIYRVAYANKLLNHPMLLYAPIAFAPFGTFFMRQWLLRSFLFRKLWCNRSRAPRFRCPGCPYRSGGRSVSLLFPGIPLHFLHMVQVLSLSQVLPDP